MNQAASVTSLADWATGEGKEVSSINQNRIQKNGSTWQIAIYDDVKGGGGVHSSVDPCHPWRHVQPLPDEGLGGRRQLAHGQRWMH